MAVSSFADKEMGLLELVDSYICDLLEKLQKKYFQEQFLAAVASSRLGLYLYLKGARHNLIYQYPFICFASAFRLFSQIVFGIKPAGVSSMLQQPIFVEDSSHYRVVHTSDGRRIYGPIDYVEVYRALINQDIHFARFFNYSHLFDKAIFTDITGLPGLPTRYYLPSFVDVFSFLFRRFGTHTTHSPHLLYAIMHSVAKNHSLASPEFLSYLQYFRYKYLPEFLLFWQIWKNVLSKYIRNSPIFMTGEYGPRFYPAVALSGSGEYSSSVVAVQHGYISPSHMDYFHKYTTPSVTGSFGCDNFLVPSVTVLQGPYYFRLLRRMGFPATSLKVIGQPRYDYLARADEIFSREKILSTLGIPSNSKVVLWVSQAPGLSKQELLATTRIFKQFLSRHPNVFLIVKKHPLESTGNSAYLRALHNVPRVLIVGDEFDSAELVYAADIVALKNSTVGMEAILLNTPILLLDPFGGKGDSLYTDYGFYTVVRSVEDMETYYDLLAGDALEDNFKRARNRFVRDHFSNFGKAAMKFSQFLQSLL